MRNTFRIEIIVYNKLISYIKIIFEFLYNMSKYIIIQMIKVYYNIDNKSVYVYFYYNIDKNESKRK